MHRLSILVTSSWIPGGVTTWAHEFANQLVDRGHDVTCVFVQMKWPLIRTPPRFQDVRYKTIWLEPTPPFFLSAIPAFLSTFLRAHPIDIVVSTEAEGTAISDSKDPRLPTHIAVLHIPEPVYVRRRDLVLSGMRLIRDIVFSPMRWMRPEPSLTERLVPIYWQWVQYLGRRRLKRAPIVVCVSDAQSQSIQAAWGIRDEKIRVIYNGIDTKSFSPPSGDLRSKNGRLLFVGGSNPRKGVDVLLDAFVLVARRNPSVVLDLVGGWDWSREIARAKNLGIFQQVRFHPYIPHYVMPAYYMRSYALIAPTRGESFGRVVAEAMACGVPVISTLRGSVPEVVDNGVSGILVPWRDVQALAQAIRDLLSNPQVAEDMGKAGRRRVETYFAWDVIILQWEELFSSVAAANRRGPDAGGQ